MRRVPGLWQVEGNTVGNFYLVLVAPKFQSSLIYSSCSQPGKSEMGCLHHKKKVVSSEASNKKVLPPYYGHIPMFYMPESRG